MLAEGYGCRKDPEAAAQWAAKARRRGGRMQGVYCTL
jgi:TPR repeat protein